MFISYYNLKLSQKQFLINFESKTIGVELKTMDNIIENSLKARSMSGKNK